jgi:hypothetical protein
LAPSGLPVFGGVLAIPQLYGMVALRVRRGADESDEGSYAALQLLVAAGVLLGYLVANRVQGAALSWHRTELLVAGLTLMLSGAAFTVYTFVALGAYFTVHVAVRANQLSAEKALAVPMEVAACRAGRRARQRTYLAS